MEYIPTTQDWSGEFIMPIIFVKKMIYDFVDLRDDYKYVTLRQIRIFAKNADISMKDMGYAMQELKSEGRLYFTQKRGWRVR